MNQILTEVDFLKNLSSEMTMLNIYISKVNELVTARAEKLMEQVKKFEKEMKND